MDLWEDFECTKHSPPFPYPADEQFFRFQTVFYVNGEPARLFVAAAHHLTKDTFEINNIVFEKATVCKCGASDMKWFHSNNGNITKCSECA